MRRVRSFVKEMTAQEVGLVVDLARKRVRIVRKVEVTDDRCVERSR